MVMMIDFSVLWRYFAWCNQTLAVFTLWAVTVYLARRGSIYLVTLLPAMFMTVVCTSYLLCAPRPEGLGLAQSLAVGLGLMVAVCLTAMFFVYVKRKQPVLKNV